jgi:choice-of-anchor A domain-containing protein
MDKLIAMVRSSFVAAVILLVAGQVHATNVNPFTSLGSAGPSNWQILTLGGCTSHSGCDTSPTNLSINASQVDGNIGIAPKGNITGGTGGAQVYGNLDLDTAGSYSYSGSYTFTGTFNQNSATDTLLDNATTAAINAYNAATGDSAAGVTCSGTGCSLTTDVNPTHALTFTGGSGLNVVNLTNLELNNHADGLTLSAPANGYFVINVTGTFSVLNGADITVAGGLSQLNVLYNVESTGTAVCFSSGSSCSNTGSTTADIQGVVLAPYRDISLDGAQVDGELISGNLNLTLNNNSTVDVPEPATLMFLATGLAGLGFRIRRTRLG